MLTTHLNIIHLYAKNHDKTHPRVSTLPIGVRDRLFILNFDTILYIYIHIQLVCFGMLVCQSRRTHGASGL